MAAAKPIPDYSRLSRADEALILKLAHDGRQQTDIAQLVGCSQGTVSNVLTAFTDTRPLARLTLNSNAQRLAKRVIEKANVEESLEVLERIEVLPPKQESGHNNLAMQVIVNMPGQTRSEPPVLDLSPVPRNELTDKSTG